MIETHLIGITKEQPKARTFDGKSACRFSVSVPGLQGREELVLYCESFDKEADTLVKYLKKNEGVYIIGDLDMRTYYDKSGTFLAPLVVKSSTVKFLGSIKPSATHIWVTAKGNLGDKPDKDETDKGLTVCDFDVAVHDTRRDSNGKKTEKTTWVAVTTWNGKADACHQYLTKGSKVEVRGSHVGSETWQTESGEDRADLTLTARHVEFLDRRPGSTTSTPENEDGDMPW